MILKTFRTVIRRIAGVLIGLAGAAFIALTAVIAGPTLSPAGWCQAATVGAFFFAWAYLAWQGCELRHLAAVALVAVGSTAFFQHHMGDPGDGTLYGIFVALPYVVLGWVAWPREQRDRRWSEDPRSGFYVTGGTLMPGSPSYVPRRADDELYEALAKGEFCYVLTSRQMGKSSLMARTAHRLREAGVRVAALDLTALGQNLSPEQWYGGLMLSLGQQLGLEDEVDEFYVDQERLGPLHRWMTAIREVVLPGTGIRSSVLGIGEADPAARAVSDNPNTQHPTPNTQLVIFIDEVDVDQQPAVCHRRVLRGDPRVLQPPRAGLATGTAHVLPARGSHAGGPDPGRSDNPLQHRPADRAHGLHGGGGGAARPRPGAQLGRKERAARRLLRRVLYWTGGHPYLTQRLCRAVVDNAAVRKPADVDRLATDLYFSPRAQERDDNLLFVRERVLNSEQKVELLNLYDQVRSGRRVWDDEGSPLVGALRLAGIVRSHGGRLVVRNRIYERVFDRDWIRENLPGAERRRQEVAFRRGIRQTMSVTGIVIGTPFLVFAVWMLYIDADPVITIPPTTLPSPNGYDQYLAAARRLESVPALEKLDQLSALEKQAAAPIHQSALATLRSGLRQDCRHPLLTWREEYALLPRNRLRELGQLLCREGGTHARARRWDEAARCCLEAAHYGAELTRGPVGRWGGIGAYCQGLAQEELWPTVTHLTPAQSNAAARRLECIAAREWPLPDQLQAQRYAHLATLREVFRVPGWRWRLYRRFWMGGMLEDPGAYGMRPPLTETLGVLGPSLAIWSLPHTETDMVRSVNYYYDRARQDVQLPYGVPREDWVSPFLAKADIFTISVLGAPGDLQFWQLRLTARRSLLQTALVLHAFRLQHGRYPADLALLVPDYLPHLPLDPFAPKRSLTYRPGSAGYNLYSVGPDGKDDGGKPIAGPADRDDTGDITAGPYQRVEGKGGPPRRH